MRTCWKNLCIDDELKLLLAVEICRYCDLRSDAYFLSFATDAMEKRVEKQNPGNKIVAVLPNTKKGIFI